MTYSPDQSEVFRTIVDHWSSDGTRMVSHEVWGPYSTLQDARLRAGLQKLVAQKDGHRATIRIHASAVEWIEVE